MQSRKSLTHLSQEFQGLEMLEGYVTDKQFHHSTQYNYLLVICFWRGRLTESNLIKKSLIAFKYFRVSF